jgi:putative transcriptional regulator
MRQLVRGLIVCAGIGTAGVAAAPDPAASLKPGVLLYAMPGLPDPNFARTVVLLLEHGSQGSLGVVLNRPSEQRLESILDLKSGAIGLDVPLWRGGPVQPQAVLALVRTVRPGPGARTILPEVHLTQDFDEVRAVLALRDGRLRAKVFSGYAGWDRGQLAAEVRGGSWVIDRADAATVFSPEPSRMWEKVHEIRSRLQALDWRPLESPVAAVAALSRQSSAASRRILAGT